MNSAIKERPLLFSAPMVRSLLDGSKTQTRRLVKGSQIPKSDSKPDYPGMEFSAVAQKHPRWGFCVFGSTEQECATKLAVSGCCPYGQPGDRLWVRESFWGCDLPGYGDQPCVVYDDEWSGKDYAPAQGRPWARKFGRIPSIHMPRDCSRILLEIVSVRVERLTDICEADADAEGCERLDSERETADWALCDRCGGTRLHRELGPNGGVIEDVDCVECDTYVKRYKHLWESINGAGSWAANPWVWVISFHPVANK